MNIKLIITSNLVLLTSIVVITVSSLLLGPLIFYLWGTLHQAISFGFCALPDYGLLSCLDSIILESVIIVHIFAILLTLAVYRILSKVLKVDISSCYWSVAILISASLIYCFQQFDNVTAPFLLEWFVSLFLLSIFALLINTFVLIHKSKSKQ